MKRRIFSIITALALCLSLLPGTALAEEEFVVQAVKGELSASFTAEQLDPVFQNDTYSGSTFTLLKDIERTGPLNIGIDCTLNLGGYKISSSSGVCIHISEGANVIIEGEGEVISESSHALWVEGSATLEGGTFTSGNQNSSGVYVNDTKTTATLSVTGKNVVIRNATGSGIGLKVFWAKSIQLSSGTYSGWRAIDLASGSFTLGQLLGHSGDTRYAFFDKNGELLTGKLNDQSLPGTVTVGVCTHSWNEDCLCTACGAEAVAIVTAGGETTCYGDFASAWNAANGKTATLRLLKSTAVDGKLELTGGDVTLEMEADAELSQDTELPFMFICVFGGKLTINSGTILSPERGALYCGENGQLYIFDCTVDGHSAVSVYGGFARIQGGTFLSENCSLEVSGSTSDVKISGGTFQNSKPLIPTIAALKKLPVGELLAEGYAYKQDGAWVSDTSVPTLKGRITVEEAPVKITRQPEDVTITYGEPPTLAIEAEGEGDIAYQWYYVVEDEDGNEAEKTPVSGGASATLTLPRLDAGTHQLCCTATCGGLALQSKTVTVTVEQKPVTPAISGTATKTYDGTREVPGGLTITLLGVEAGDDVTAAASCEYDTPDAGENKTITASGITLGGAKAGNYTLTADTATAAGSITRASAAITWGNASQTLSYTGSAAEIAPPTVTLVNGESFSGSIRYSYAASGSPDYVSGLPVNAGTYSVKASIAEQANYAAAESAAMTLEISKIDYAGAMTASTSGRHGTEKSYDLSGLLPEGCKLGTPVKTDANSIFDGDPAVDGATLAYKLADNAEAGQTGTITIPVTESTNYTPFDLTITVTVMNQIVPTLTINPISVTYTGSAVPDSAIHGTATAEGKNIPGAWSFAGGQALTNVSDSGTKTVIFTPANGTDYAPATGTVPVTITKATPGLRLTPSADALPGGGEVTLTLTGLPAGGTASVTCSGGITVMKGTGNTWTAVLPNSTATYTFAASYAGDASHHPASASCTVSTKEVTVLPDPPAGDSGTKFQLVMETGISEVPAGLKDIASLNTPEKLEAAMKTEITQTTPDVPEAHTAVYDVALLVSADGGKTWAHATAGNFPSGGLTITLPYPEGTGQNTHDFTVIHMFTTTDFGKTPGTTEQPEVTKTAEGIRFTVTGLSPIAVAWKTVTPPPTPVPPTGGGSHWSGGDQNIITYAVTVGKTEHGKVTSNRVSASNGSTVTLTAAPESGYVLDTLTVTDSRGNEIKLTGKGDGKYSFTMPGRAVTVTATFAPLPDDTPKPCGGGADCPSRAFADLDTGTWYHEAADFVLRNGLMGGYGNGLFGPEDNLSRAQFAQILYNREGKPAVTGGNVFSDVASGQWYAPAVTWAATRGIVNGYGNGGFGPNDNITREQLAVMLWRYAGSPAATERELHFADAGEADGWALEALRWAVENGVMSGEDGGILDPQGLATRAQAAQMLKNFLEE